MDVTATIRDRTLRRERSPDEFDVYRAALEWDLVDPIVIENRDDLKSENRWEGSDRALSSSGNKLDDVLPETSRHFVGRRHRPRQND
jgi:hypothetical protein